MWYHFIFGWNYKNSSSSRGQKSKVIYILCCEECAVPREFKLKEIDSILYANPPASEPIESNTLITAKEDKTDTLKINLNKNSMNISLGPGGILAFFLPAHISYERLYQGKFLVVKIHPF